MLTWLALMGQQTSSKFPSGAKSPILEPPPDTEIDPSDIETEPKPKSTLGYTGPFFSSLFIQNSNGIVLGGSDGSLFHYSTDSSSICSLNGHTSDITSLALDPSLDLIASGSRDEYICLWGTKQIAQDETKHRSYPINNLHGHELTVTGLTIQEGQLFSGSRDNTVCLWDINSGVCINRCSIARNLVTCVRWIPGEPCVLQSSEDKHLRVWDTRTMDVVQNLLHPKCLLTACDVSQEGHYFYTSSRGPVENTATATQWDRRASGIVREFPHLSDNLHTCIVDNELDCLITASNGGSMYLWDIKTGFLLCEKKLNSGPIYSVYNVPNSRDILCSTHKRGVQVLAVNRLNSVPLPTYNMTVKSIIL